MVLREAIWRALITNQVCESFSVGLCQISEWREIRRPYSLWREICRSFTLDVMQRSYQGGMDERPHEKCWTFFFFWLSFFLFLFYKRNRWHAVGIRSLAAAFIDPSVNAVFRTGCEICLIFFHYTIKTFVMIIHYFIDTNI